MSVQLTDADVVTFVLAGCNAAEIAAYGGFDEHMARARMIRARVLVAHQGDGASTPAPAAATQEGEAA